MAYKRANIVFRIQIQVETRKKKTKQNINGRDFRSSSEQRREIETKGSLLMHKVINEKKLFNSTM